MEITITGQPPSSKVREATPNADRENLDASLRERQLCQRGDEAVIDHWQDDGGSVLSAVRWGAAPEVVMPHPANPHIGWIIETLRCFLFLKEEAAEFNARIIAEFERRLPELLKAATLAALLPAIRQRAVGFYQSKRVPFWDAEDLASKLVVKVSEGLQKDGCRGNPGAWISQIRFTILMDFWRAKQRERNGLGDRQDAALLADIQDASFDEASLRLLIDELPADLRELVAQAIRGDECPPIAAQTLDQLRDAIQSLEWPEDSVPLRKRRGRRAS